MLTQLIRAIVCLTFVSTATGNNAIAANASSPLKHSDVVFMYAADDEAYKAYGATFVGWGGASTAAQVKRHHKLGIRCTGTMWCLTSGAKLLYESAKLRAACAVDIEGKPIEVPWLFDHTHEGMKSYFGCTNHPDYRKLLRDRVINAMKGGADGLHIDDHLGVASPALWHGGGLCDHCIAAFREYLKTHATPDELKAAGVTDIDTFDYRDIVRKYAKTRAEYKKVQNNLPLREHFLAFHLDASAENIRQLGELAAETAGHPVLLSANAGLATDAHHHVLPKLTHVICEVPQNASAGTGNLSRAIEAYDVATRAGKPLAATAGGHDWAYVYEHHTVDLVRFWIALAHAHGQRFMAPHPKRQWCFSKEKGTHWYAAPIEEFAPVYQFIRKHADCFDGLLAVENPGIKAPPNVRTTVRRKGAAGRTILHVLNTDYDKATKRFRERKNVAIRLPKSLVARSSGKLKVLAYDAEPVEVALKTEGDMVVVELPTLRLWAMVVLRAYPKTRRPGLIEGEAKAPRGAFP